MEKCVDCQYYDRRNAKPNDGRATMWGQCRRHSPHLNPVTAKAYVVEGVWPLVRDDDWCGEWRTLTRAVDDWVPEMETAATQSAPARARPAATVAAAVVTLAGDD